MPDQQDPLRAPDAPSSSVAAGVAAQVAGVIWILQWAHALVVHGPTGFNQKQLWLGMTWMDSTKFLIVAYLLLLPGVLYLKRAAASRRDKPAATAGTVVVAALLVSAVATAMEFRLLEWGTYTGTFESNQSPMSAGGPIRAVASALVLSGGFAVLGVRAAMRRAMPYWLVPVLILGALATLFLGGPLPPMPGLAWLVFGAWLLAQAHPHTRPRLTPEETRLPVRSAR